MTVALTTRGVICRKGSQAHALLSWGHLCLDIRPRVGFDIEALLPKKTCVYNKDEPVIFDPDNAGLFSTPSIQLTGQKSPILGTSKRPSLSDPKAPGLYNHKSVQLTGSKVVTVMGKKNLLLSEPEEPTLTSSGTKAPDIFDKDCCDDC